MPFVSRLESVQVVERRIHRYMKVVSEFTGGRQKRRNILIKHRKKL